jgi:hypothetical protein
MEIHEKLSQEGPQSKNSAEERPKHGRSKQSGSEKTKVAPACNAELANQRIISLITYRKASNTNVECGLETELDLETHTEKKNLNVVGVILGHDP